MSGPSVRTALGDDGVLTVTLSRPEQRNPLDREAFAAIQDAFGVRAHRGDVRAVMLCGDGANFCSGLDRSMLMALGGAAEDAAQGEGRFLQESLLAVETCPRPTLAVIRGACVGGGVELMLGCDFRVASDDAFFTLMEMRYAFLPDLGGIHRLQREVGLSRAREMVYFGDRLDAATLERWGVLNEVTDGAGLDTCAKRWAQRCAAAAPLAVAAAKRIMLADPGGADGERSLREAIDVNLRTLLRSADFREGLTAAMERREPRFTGE